jgi:cytochrome c oxidase subunit 4
MSAKHASTKILWVIWASLIVLLGLTWLASRFSLGLGNTVAAMLISGMKMMLVILFFMQVRYSTRLVWVFATAGFIWWAIFISLAMTDYLTRQTVIPYNRDSIPAQRPE